MSEPSEDGLIRYVGLRSATGLVVASMIGAGIFTTTGFQAADLGHPGYIFLLWVIGGVLALCGAMCFAELGAALPRAGAEYVYIRETYGNLVAFMSAFVALFAGFSAPIAAALKSLVAYLGFFVPLLDENPMLFAGLHLNDAVAIAIAWVLTAIHCGGVKGGIGFNDAITAFKVGGIVVIIIAAFAFGHGNISGITEVSPQFETLDAPDLMAAMATSLIFVSFCYLGWNGSAYMAAEMTDPQRVLPRSLLLGTAVVTVLYLLLNMVYFYGAGVEGLAGQLEVGLVASENLFGFFGVNLVTAVLCVSILASASAMTIVGPRIYYAFGHDFQPLGWLATASPKTGSPWAALVLQGCVISCIVLSGTVDQILQYAGFTLTLFACVAVSCVIVLRVRRPDMERPFKAWGYPVTPLLFLGVSTWTMVWAVRGRPVESLLGLGTAVLGGAIFYGLSLRKSAD